MSTFSSRWKHKTLAWAALTLFVLFIHLAWAWRVTTRTTDFPIKKQPVRKQQTPKQPPKNASIIEATDTFGTLWYSCGEIARLTQQTQDHMNMTRMPGDLRLWSVPPPLSCEQLVRSIETWYKVANNTELIATRRTLAKEKENKQLDREEKENQQLDWKSIHYPVLSLHRLAKAMDKIKSSNETLKIVVMGGSMTAGHGVEGMNNSAWPFRLEKMMQQKWGPGSVEVVNLAFGGAAVKQWLQRVSQIYAEAPFDVIIGEFAVNDQTDFTEQHPDIVADQSMSLLSQLMGLPNAPAVVSMEAFRTAYSSERDANKHCEGHIENATNQNTTFTTYLCPQWWLPQTWREKASQLYSVATISYRDAVWPYRQHPPHNLDEYWSGSSHPKEDTHTLIASTVLFGLLLVFNNMEAFLEPHFLAEAAFNASSSISSLLENSDRPASPEAAACGINTTEVYMPSRTTESEVEKHALIAQDNLGGSCWQFRTDVPHKYGWICEAKNTTEPEDDFLIFRKNIMVGVDGMFVVSRLVSYDERMAEAELWFSSPGKNVTDNVFANAPSWRIYSWHKELTSVPEPMLVRLPKVFAESSGLQWHGSSLKLTMNVKLIRGKSISTRKDPLNGIDKFKLLDVTTC